jgi:myo-inositol-1-phosphate synthase
LHQQKQHAILGGMTTPRVTSPNGRLGILTPGMGAVATTLYAGVLAARQGLAKPIGSLTQMGTMPDAHGIEQPISSLVSLAGLDDIVFGGWDPISPNALEAAQTAGVLQAADLAPLSGEMEGIVAMDAVFDQQWVSRLHPTRVKAATTKYDMALQIIDDIDRFRVEHNLERVVMVWCASTEAYQEPTAVHDSVMSFEEGLKQNDPGIAPSQIYAYAALVSGVPFANGAPNLTVDLPCMIELAVERGVPICGKDFKTGQTFMKTVLAPALAVRRLGLRGWYSTNILGNRDGEVLDAPENFKTKEVSKLGVLDSILRPDLNPDLYGNIDHVVRINYYPPAGDNKEGWDNIDIFGWMGYPMQIKVNFLCRDSILAAPLALDLALFLDLAQRHGQSGLQDWLSFYFKAPQPAEGASIATNDVFAQHRALLAKLTTFAAVSQPVT